MIKNIIFDLGGVIVNVNYHLTSLAFTELGANKFNEVYSQLQQDTIFDLFETGKIDACEFRQLLKGKLNIRATDEEIDTAWNAMVLDFPLERLKFLQSLKEKYKTFLLSNINAIHLDCVQKKFFCHYEQEFTGFFQREYYSHLFGKRKPHAETFQAVLEENNLVAKETLFVDDTLQHILGAQQVGLKTLHLTPDKNIFEVEKVLLAYSAG